MVNLNGHNAGNGRNSQGEPKATCLLPYSANEIRDKEISDRVINVLCINV